jgi:hypothetical protein
MHHFDLDIGKKSKKNKFPEESNQRSLARLSLSLLPFTSIVIRKFRQQTFVNIVILEKLN